MRDQSLFNDRLQWVVLKFGGTSVSSAANWHNIATVLRERIAAGLRAAVVHSALSGITDRLEFLLSEAVSGDFRAVLAEIDHKHRALAAQLGIEPDGRFETFLHDLGAMAAAIAETREVSDRVRARVMAMGELLSTCLGATFLSAQGIETTWVDARHYLRAEQRHGSNEKAGLLSATCEFSPDAHLRSDWNALNSVVITQGFIAANEAGETVLLGRGGSDTSGSFGNLDGCAGIVQRQPAIGAQRAPAARLAL